MAFKSGFDRIWFTCIVKNQWLPIMGKPHETRKAEIIEAATQLAAGKGLRHVSAQAIADRVGIAQPTVFRHFKNRDAIFAGAIETIGQGLFAAIGKFFTASDPADERLRALIRAQLKFISRNKGLPRLLFSDRLHNDSTVLKSAIQKVMGGYYGHMAKLISDGQQDGSFRTDLDADETARFVAATIQGLIMRWSIFDFDFALEDEAEPLWRFLYSAIRA
jgi:AcrR family transcriptional regulator